MSSCNDVKYWALVSNIPFVSQRTRKQENTSSKNLGAFLLQRPPTKPKGDLDIKGALPKTLSGETVKLKSQSAELISKKRLDGNNVK